MEEVMDNLFVGDERDCQTVRGDGAWRTVHACKHPCHRNQCGDPSQGRPDYLVHKAGTDLYLNMVDMDQKQDHQFMAPMIDAALDYIENHAASHRVLLHCNQGQSRSPSLAMLYLAKRTDHVSDENYRQASRDFQERYPRFSPGRGIDLYLEDYWYVLE